LAGDLGISDVSCDAKFTWLVPGDKFNIVVDLANESLDAAAAGKVYVDIYARDESGEETFLGSKSNLSVNLGPITFDRNDNPIVKKSKVTVPIALGFDFDAGDYTFVAKVEPMAQFNSNGEFLNYLYEDDSEDNNELSTEESSKQNEFTWEFAYRVGTYTGGGSHGGLGDTRATLRKNVKMSGAVEEELFDGFGEPVDANNDGITDVVVKRLSASLTGPGYAEGLFDSETADVSFVGTNATSAFMATVTGGKKGFAGFNQFDVDESNFIVEGSLKSFKATGFNFNACEFNIAGSLGDFSCNYFDASSMTVGDETSPTSLGAFTVNAMESSELTIYANPTSTGGTKALCNNEVSDTVIASTGRFASLTFGSVSGGQIEADTFGTIDSKGDFTASVFSNGINREIIDDRGDEDPFTADDVPNLTRVALTKMTVKGQAAGLWDFDGGVGSIAIGSVNREVDGDSVSGELFVTIAGKLGTFTATGDVWSFVDEDGDGLSDDESAGLGLYAFSMNSVTCNRNLINSEIMSGVAFPYGGNAWFPTVTSELKQSLGLIGSFAVKGNVQDSIVRAGYNPYEGDVFRNTLQLSEIKKITIGGSLIGSTEFLAAVLPASVKVKVAGFGTVAQTVRKDPGLTANPQLFEYNDNDKPWLRTSHG
jgi:hypothetical protein